MSQSNTPEGWYPNPENPAELRFWDGATWTDYTAPARQTPPAYPAGNPGGQQASAWPPAPDGNRFPAQAAFVAQPPPAQVVYVQTGGKTSGLAIASLVLGILWLYWIGSILAVILGHVALSETSKNPNVQGRGMAVAGVVLGWIGVATLLMVLLLAAGMS